MRKVLEGSRAEVTGDRRAGEGKGAKARACVAREGA